MALTLALFFAAGGFAAYLAGRFGAAGTTRTQLLFIGTNLMVLAVGILVGSRVN